VPDGDAREADRPAPADGNPDAEREEGGAPSGVPTELRVTFWTLVFLIKFALIATSLGMLFIWFEGRWRLGGGLVGLGVVLAGFGAYRYRRFRSARAESP